MITAIYTRQSIDKQDSVSIESQIDYCKKFVDTEYEIYTDKGFSGKNTDRPNFLRLKKDIADGKINKVIAYRLDRISRNIKDFAELIEFFESNDVAFASATEQFDTSSPIGRALVYIIMTFAQLERETIVKRITDAYYFRAKQGLFTGGGCPLGYQHETKIINGKKASILKTDPSDKNKVEQIFNLYSSGHSLHSIVLYCNQKKLFNKNIHSTTIKRILDNPAYTYNTPQMYEYLKSKGYIMANPIDEWDGTKGVMIFGKEVGKGTSRKMMPIEKQLVVIGNFVPFIENSTWFSCQIKKSQNKATKRSGTSSLSFLTGKLKCAECGYSFGVKVTPKNNKTYKHFFCRGRSNLGNCDNSLFIPLEELEETVTAEINAKIKTIDFTHLQTKDESSSSKERIEIIKINEEIENLISALASGNATTNKYINDKIEQLDARKKDLEKKISLSELASMQQSTFLVELKNKIDLLKETDFSSLDMLQKKELINLLIEQIKIASDGCISIIWRG